MSDDFLRDLRTELRAAAERKSSLAPTYREVKGTNWRSRMLPAVAALAAVAVGVAIVLAVARGGGPDREIPASPPRADVGVSVALPGMARQQGCGPDAQSGAPSHEVLDSLAVLRRAQREPDAMPVGIPSAGEPDRWLPVFTYDSTRVRRPAPTLLHRELHLAPTNDLKRCDAPRESGPGPGVCLVAGGSGEPLQVKCFTLADIKAGKAVALSDPTGTGARLTGVVPDGISGVQITVRGRTLELPVYENAYERYVNHLRPGDRATVRMIKDIGSCAEGAKPSPQLAQLVPLLTTRSDAGMEVPPEVFKRVGQLAVRRAARFAGGGDEIEHWVVPYASPHAPTHLCGARPVRLADNVCVFAFATQTRHVISGACTTDTNDAVVRFSPRQKDGIIAVDGIAKRGAAALLLHHGDTTRPVPVRKGIVAQTFRGDFPIGATWGEASPSDETELH